MNTLYGTPIKAVNSYSDLGVLFDHYLKFRSHAATTAQSTGFLCNLALRSFIVSDPTVYLNLFRALIRPKIEYCAEVWRPLYDKDAKLLQSVPNRFRCRVAFRWGIDKDALFFPSIADIFQTADDRAFTHILRSG